MNLPLLLQEDFRGGRISSTHARTPLARASLSFACTSLSVMPQIWYPNVHGDQTVPFIVMLKD